MKLVDPSQITEDKFHFFINEFKTAGERLVPYSLNQRGLDFKSYIKSLNNESLGIDIPKNWVPASTYFLLNTWTKLFLY